MPTLSDIAALIGCPAPAEGSRPVTGVATLTEAKPDELSFISSESFAEQLNATRAAGVIMAKKLRLPPPADKQVLVVDDTDLAVAKVLELFAPPTPRPPIGVDPAARVAKSASLGDGVAVSPGVIMAKKLRLPPPADKQVLVVDDTDLAVAKVLELFAPPTPRPPAGADPAARVAKSAILGDGVAVSPGAYVGERSRVGARTVLHPGVYVGDDVTLGDDCVLFPNVVIRERITIGNRVIIHAGSVLGTDGFGYRWDGAKHAKVPQIGTVIVEDDVEIGSCVCVDRAKFAATRIGRGTKIDNLVQIAHNVQVGPHCIIVAHVGIAGSAKLGAGVVLGGQVAIRDHITLGDGVMVAATSAIAEDVPPKTFMSGTPALPHRQSLREQAAMRRLPDLVVQMRKLQEQLDEMKKKLEE